MVASVHEPAVGPEDLVGVRSRVSWAAIFAGATVALAVYLVLTLLGGALGLTISDNVRSGTLSGLAAVWAIMSAGVALFLGGWVTTQIAVGENKFEAGIHGVIMWGVVLVLILWLVGLGLRAGFSAMLGAASFTSSVSRDATSEDWEAAARRANVPQETINDWKQKASNAPGDAGKAAGDPETQRKAAEYATHATWYTLAGVVLSMLCAVAGALVGAGPTFRVFAVPVGVRRTTAESREYVTQR